MTPTDEEIRDAFSHCVGHDTDSYDMSEAVKNIRALFRASLTRVEEERDEAVKARVEASNQWRLDYNTLAGERDALLMRLSEVSVICERESERFPRVMGDFAREVLSVISRPTSAEGE